MSSKALQTIEDFQIEKTDTTDFVPAHVIAIELGQPLSCISAFDEHMRKRYQRVLCFVRLHTHPIGSVELHISGDQADPSFYCQLIWRALGEQINNHLRLDGLATIADLDGRGIPSTKPPHCIEAREQLFADAPFVSVAVATRDRPQGVLRCLNALMDSYYPSYEIIVVDNAPSTDETEKLITHMAQEITKVRYVREDRPGLSHARNCGLSAARGHYVVFTDDDVVVDKYWLIELIKAFKAAENVACVTGLVLPLELETPAQAWLEEYGGFSKGFALRAFNMKKHHPGTPLYPYTSGSFGTGACSAFDVLYLRSAGGFDPALGTGTPARGGEDLAAFFQVIKRGYTLVYTPAALLYHPHHREYEGLCKQMFNYGVGLTAYLTKIIFDNPLLLLELLTKVPYGLFFILSKRSSKNSRKSANYPEELTKLERRGMLYGFSAYIQSWWRMYNKLRKAM